MGISYHYNLEKPMQATGTTNWLLMAWTGISLAARGLDWTGVHEIEVTILQALDFRLGHRLPIHFLRRASKIAEVSVEQHVLSKYLLELSILDYDIVHILPSRTAAAASCLALKLLNGSQWTTTLQYYMSYSDSELVPVM